MSEEYDPLVNVPAEAMVLGGLLLDNKAIPDVADGLKADDFAEPLHQRIFSAMLRFHAKGMGANAVSLRPIFAMDIDADGGAYLDALVDSPVVAIGIRDHASQVAELAVRRKARDALRRGINGIEDLEISVGDVIGGVEEQAWAAQREDIDHPVLGMGDMVGLVQERQARLDRGEQAIGATNALITDLDAAIGPLELATYTILAGRPGMGKTTVAGSASIGYSLRGAHGLYLNTEMSDEHSAMRLASDLSFAMGRGIEHKVIKAGKLNPGERQWLDRVRERAALLPLRYQKIGGCNVRRVYSIVAREKARLAALGQKLWFVVVDYIGMLEADDALGRPIDDDRKRMNQVSKMMMRIRDELGVAVIALAQLSRKVDERADKRPMNADLKETGNLEQDADAILFAYREEYYLELEEPKPGETDPKGKSKHEQWETDMNIARGKLDLIVGKNRHDQRRTRTVKFIGRHYAVRSGNFYDNDVCAELDLDL